MNAGQQPGTQSEEDTGNYIQRQQEKAQVSPPPPMADIERVNYHS